MKYYFSAWQLISCPWQPLNKDKTKVKFLLATIRKAYTCAVHLVCMGVRSSGEFREHLYCKRRDVAAVKYARNLYNWRYFILLRFEANFTNEPVLCREAFCCSLLAA